MAATFTRVSPLGMAANHKAAAPRGAATTSHQQVTTTANVSPLLELGATVFILFRGRAYAVPPVPWRLGEKLAALRAAAVNFGPELLADQTPSYYKLIGELPKLLWGHMRPVGLMWRLLRKLRLLRNPFQQATEAELVELSDFVLGRRMRSSVSIHPPVPRHSYTTG